MSIVERAVEMAQSVDKAAEAKQPRELQPDNLPPGHEPLPHAAPPLQDSSPSFEDTPPMAHGTQPSVRVDIARLRGLGRLPPEDHARNTHLEIRRIKWPLLSAIAGRDGTKPVRNNVILVTSALPGEGKSFTALNLALSIVRDRELRVVLVDADVARPGLTPALGLEADAGLNEVLEDRRRDIRSVIYQTDVEGLSVVPAGKWQDQASELLSSNRMLQIIQDLIRYVGNGVIILDSPPLLATNEAQVLSRHVGQVLLVVRADDTEQRVVKDAIALIDDSASISAVLNQVRPSILGRYYGEYGHSYGYGAAYEDDGRGTQRRQKERGADDD